MFGRGGVFWLLAHELRISWRNWLAAGRQRGGRGRIAMYLLLALVLGVGGFWAADAVSPLEPAPTPLILGAIGAVFMFLLTFMVSQALMLITEALYQRGDLDLLLASPLPAWRILVVRMAAVALNVAAFYLAVVIAVFVWLPWFGGWRWMGFAPSVLALALFATAMAIVAARLLFRVIGAKATRIGAQIIASIMGAAFFLAIQTQNYVPPGERAAAYRALLARLIPVLGDPESPLSLPARAAIGQLGALAIWIGAAIAFYLIAVWWFARAYLANASAIAGLGASRRRADLRTRATRGGVTASLVRKEWRLILRDPLLLSQILLPIIYFVPMFLGLTRLSREGLSQFAIPSYASAFVLISTTLAASLAWLTVSAEDAPDLIASAPITRDQIDSTKAIAAGAPVLALMAAPAAFSSLLSAFAGFWVLLGAAFAIASACLIAIWYQRPGSRKNFRRRTRAGFFINLAQVFITFCWTGATWFAVFGWPLISIIPALIALGLLLALHESRPAAQAPKPAA
jgi:ABC-2 type transport system permease protein